ncbi:MAG: cell division protein ZapB [Desulfobulbaceae bacterium]|nr:MAG: cell division protein ZapB [Desulfobulbaceae bacterium]
MEKGSGIEQLEGYIEKLLAGYNDLRAEVSRLETALKNSQSEVDRLKGELAELDGERGNVLERVNSLIAKIEVWENETHPEETQPAVVETHEATPAQVDQPQEQQDQQLEDYLDDQEPSAEEDENEGGVQGNLFADHFR